MANSSIRYGRRIRKTVSAIKRNKIALYRCEVCGKTAVERIDTSIWRCRHCNTTYAGGAYTMTTPIGEVSKQQIRSLGKSGD